MSTATLPPPRGPVRPDSEVPDPTWKPGEPVLGKRHRRLLDAEGRTVDWECLPLGPGDLLHPHELDEFAVDKLHSEFCCQLRNIGRLRYANDPTAVYLIDVNVDLGLPGVAAIRPDFAAMLGVTAQIDDSIKTFYVRREPRPIRLPVMIEVTSETTRDNDYVVKMPIYGRSPVEQYVIIDVDYDNYRVAFEDFRRARGRLVPHGGRRDYADIPSLGVRLQSDGHRLIITDLETGEVLGDYDEIFAQRDQERRRREEEARLRVQEREQAVKDLAAEKERAVAAEKQIAAEKKRADAEKERAEKQIAAAKKRADAEKERAEKQIAAEKKRADAEKERAEKQIAAERERAARDLAAEKEQNEAQKRQLSQRDEEIERLRRLLGRGGPAPGADMP